jgi:RNA-directed DNA polymerase
MLFNHKLITEIREDFDIMQSKEDLLLLINKVKIIVYGEDTYPISMRQFNYYIDPTVSKKRYKQFTITKKSGSRRTINSPVSTLKVILRCINFIFQCVSEIHSSAYGFVPEKNIVDNAKLHVNRKYVFNLDLKDFFHSFERRRVKFALMEKPFGLNKDKEKLAFLLASICTHPIEIEEEIKIVLPQGSPTSPTLTNILCKRLDRRLSGLAKYHNARYSRYADDITFSSEHNIFSKEEFKTELNRIIVEDQRLLLNPSKTRLQKLEHRQEVTGLIVNEKVNVRRRYIKQIRMWIYYWEKYGYAKAQKIFLRDYKKDKGHVKKGVPNLDNVLLGKLEFLKMVRGFKDPLYMKLVDRFDKLNQQLIQGVISADGMEESEINNDQIIEILMNKGLNEAMKLYKTKKKNG